MKTRLSHLLLAIILITVMVLPSAAQAQSTSDRPLIVIESYYLDVDTVRPGDTFKLFLSIKNVGQSAARNLIFTFSGSDFLPKETGGVKAVDPLGVDGKDTIVQSLVASTDLWGKLNGMVTVNLSYSDDNGVAYTASFLVTIDVLGWSAAVAKTSTPTPTATSMPRAQLGITGYRTNLDPLQPGSIFALEMDIRNLGGGDAKNVSMILGGGTAGGTNPEGTPQPGGISGAGADLATFAPIESSNVQFLGDIATGETYRAEQKLIVNVSANPGAYALKISFVYLDAKGARQVDDQVITLLVFQLPQVEVNYYRDPGMIMSGQPNTLPIQVVNLGRKPAVMGNMTVTADAAELMNNTSLVGTLDAGGYFPLDVTVIPQAAGPLDITIKINYTDDFNQARTIEQVMTVDVVEGGFPSGGEGMPGTDGQGGIIIDPGMPPNGGMQPSEEVTVQETFWQKVLRFFKGLFGLDSSAPQPQPQPGPGEVIPPDVQPANGNPGGKG